MEASIAVSGLQLNYGSKSVIENLNLAFKSHSFSAIVGNNGSGKSTFLRAICGLHNEFAGTVRVNDKSLKELNDPFRSGAFSFLSQNQDISFNISVSELLLMGRYRFKNTLENYSKEDVDAVQKVIARIGIEKYMNNSFYELSGGEQQLVLIAQSLVQDADIYLFDEPTQNLDLKNANFIMQLIAELPKKGKTVLCATHDLHLLGEVKGEMVNFSSDEIRLLPITTSNLEQHITALKS